MLVVATGARTRFGGIAAALQSSEPPSAFERGIHRLGVLILRLTSFLVLFVLLANLALGRPALESFLFAVALAVSWPLLAPRTEPSTLAEPRAAITDVSLPKRVGGQELGDAKSMLITPAQVATAEVAAEPAQSAAPHSRSTLQGATAKTRVAPKPSALATPTGGAAVPLHL